MTTSLSPVARLPAVARRIEGIALQGGCACLMALMLVVTADVAFRYVLNHPFVWSHDVITLYITPGLFFLTLSDSHRVGAQVNVDVLHRKLPLPVRRAADALCDLLALCVFGLIAYGGALRALDSWRGGDVVTGAVPWPIWPSTALVPLGAGMLVVRLAASLVANAAGGTDPASHPHDLPAEGAFE